MLDCRRIVRPLFNDAAGVEEVMSSGELTLEGIKGQQGDTGPVGTCSIGSVRVASVQYSRSARTTSKPKVRELSRSRGI